MPATLVVVGLGLYLLRRRRPVAALWAVVDRSIGMWPDPIAARPRSDGEAPPDALPAADEIAYRIGVPGAVAPSPPDRLVVSGGTPSGGVRAGGARRVLWRDSAVALVAVSAVVLVAVVVLPGLPHGAVLTATDTDAFQPR